MTESVTVFYFFDEQVDEATVRDALSFCRKRCVPTDQDQDPDGERLATEGGFVEFMYEEIAFSLATRFESNAVPELPALVLHLDALYFRPRDGLNTIDDVRSHSDQLIELVRLLYERLVETDREPVYVLGLGPGDEEVLSNPDFEEQVTTDGLRGDQLEFISWLQILPPRIVENYGVETLQSAPASRVDVLSNGAVCLVVDTTPTMIESVYEPEAVEAYLHG